MPDFNLTWFLIGCGGGMLPDILRLINNRYEAAAGGYLKTGTFWLGFVLLVGLGGLAAWLAGATSAQAALAYGFSAPEIISRLVKPKEEDPNRRTIVPDKFQLLKWWSS